MYDLEDADWSTLVNYLAHQTPGNQAVSITVFGGYICLGVMERMNILVGELVYQPVPDETAPLIRAYRNVDIQGVICFYES